MPDIAIPPIDPSLVLTAIISAVIGALLAWGWIGATRAAATARLAAERDEAARDRDELRREAEERDRLIVELRRDLSAETERRSDAEARARRVEPLEIELRDTKERFTQAQSDRAALEARVDEERRSTTEKLALIEDARAKLADAFKALSAEALSSNNKSFVELAKATLEQYQTGAKADLDQRSQAIAALVEPVQKSLTRFDEQVRELEKARVGAYETLRQQIGSMVQTQDQLRSETGNLVRALRAPQVRGRWGEIQLRRVAELAGMLDHCDFYEQQSRETGDGGRQRPDMIVRLPGGKTLVIDAKTPLDGYLDATAATDDETRRLALIRHARHVRDHMKALGAKQYWNQFEHAPEFVVMFLPGESFFSAALETDPSLIEAGIDQSVIPATPTTLIALMRAVAYGWRQERLAENARVIAQLGRELHDRLATMSGHFARLGGQLGNAVDSYNKTLASLESRVLVSARRLKDLDAASDTAEIGLLDAVEAQPRLPVAGSSDAATPDA